MITLYDSDRCPYCARVRIVLAEKGIPYEAIAIDLRDRPAWLYEKNSSGKVPVIEEDGCRLPAPHCSVSLRGPPGAMTLPLKSARRSEVEGEEGFVSNEVDRFFVVMLKSPN